jgi:hypothetical protein
MSQVADKRKGKERPGRPSIRRSPEYKAKLSVASDLLAAKMEEKRLWGNKIVRSKLIEEAIIETL